jgi:hypothetical protein
VRDAEIIESVNDGYLHFWMNPKKTWRNNIYEAVKNQTNIENQHEVEAVEDIPRSEEDFLRKVGLLRDM